MSAPRHRGLFYPPSPSGAVHRTFPIFQASILRPGRPRSRPPAAPALRSSPFGYLFMPFKSSSFTKSKFKFSFLASILVHVSSILVHVDGINGSTSERHDQFCTTSKFAHFKNLLQRGRKSHSVNICGAALAAWPAHGRAASRYYFNLAGNGRKSLFVHGFIDSSICHCIDILISKYHQR